MMSRIQDDRGVQPEPEEMIIAGDETIIEIPDHVLDATNRPAAEEDDMGGD